MEDGIVKVAKDKEKAKSILKMAKTTIDMVRTIDEKKFPSNVLKEYYDVIRELILVVMLLDGYKTYGEGAHRKAIEYLGNNYDKFQEHEILLVDQLRIKRNKIAYDGFFVREDYVERKRVQIENIISKLVKIVEERIG